LSKGKFGGNIPLTDIGSEAGRLNNLFLKAWLYLHLWSIRLHLNGLYHAFQHTDFNVLDQKPFVYCQLDSITPIKVEIRLHTVKMYTSLKSSVVMTVT